MANQWFKFYGSEYLSDPKILQLNGNERSCWVTLMALASQTKDGVIRFLSESQLLLHSGVTDSISVLKKFEELEMIEICNGHVTVKNWVKRQLSESIFRVREHRLKQKSNGESNASVTTERKNRKKERIERELPDWINKKIWEEWEEYRKSIKKTLTPISIKKQLQFLSGFKADHITIIEKSIQNGWTGLFPLNKNNKSYTGDDFIRDKEKISDRIKDINYEHGLKIENEVKILSKKIKI